MQSQSYEAISAETFFVGAEEGVSTTKVLIGDISKPISFYATNASEWWKFWEYKVGIQLNIDNIGVAYAMGSGEHSLIIAKDDISMEFICGANKLAFTQSYDVNFKNRTASTYYHGYIRTLPTIGAAVLTYYTAGAAIPLLQSIGTTR